MRKMIKQWPKQKRTVSHTGTGTDSIFLVIILLICGILVAPLPYLLDDGLIFFSIFGVCGGL